MTEKYGTVVSKPTTFINNHDIDHPIDVAFVDEAHLLLTQGKQSYKGKNQLQDIIERARVTVVMFDEYQVLTTEQYWEADLLEKYREKAKCANNYGKFHYVSINSKLKSILTGEQAALNSIMFLLIPVPKPTAYLLHETPLFCRPLQNISFLSHSSSYVLVTPPILAIFYFCRFPAFFTLSQVDRNHYIFIISSFLLA